MNFLIVEDSKWPRTQSSMASSGWLQPQHVISSSLSQLFSDSEYELQKNPLLGSHGRADSPQQGRETQPLGFWEGLKHAYLPEGKKQTPQ